MILLKKIEHIYDKYLVTDGKVCSSIEKLVYVSRKKKHQMFNSEREKFCAQLIGLHFKQIKIYNS